MMKQWLRCAGIWSNSSGKATILDGCRRTIATGCGLVNKQKAQQAIADYRQALQKAETDTGVRVENQAVTDKLSTMEQELNEAFSGPAPQQEEKRNRAAKTRHGESLKSQRSQ